MAQTVHWFSGFESGDASEVVSLGAGHSIVTTPVRTGGYALNGINGSTVLSTTMGSTQCAYRFHLLIQQIPSSQRTITTERFSTTNRLAVQMSTSANLRIADSGATLGLTTTFGTFTFAPNIWYMIDVVLDLAAGGVIKVWVNGILDVNITHTNDVSASVTSGWTIGGAVAPNDNWYDDLRLDIGGVNPIGAGRTIARQGKAGTPTYDAWAKSGAATAALCWSDTPFSAATNCNSSTSGAAQTTLIGSFSADPARAEEGGQTITSIDVINACKVGVIAKRATSGNPSIRRRVGGVNTDTAETVGTADGWFDDGIWTASLANLNAMEAGMVKAADGNLTTAEDVWAMVEYTEVLMPQIWM